MTTYMSELLVASSVGDISPVARYVLPLFRLGGAESHHAASLDCSIVGALSLCALGTDCLLEVCYSVAGLASLGWLKLHSSTPFSLMLIGCNFVRTICNGLSAFVHSFNLDSCIIRSDEVLAVGCTLT